MTETTKSDRNEAKPAGYFASVRRDILPLLPRNSGRLLDVGCGEGATSAFLKQEGYCQWACGLEIFPAAAAIAKKRLDQVIEGNIESMELPLPKSSFDIILCLDVLEHLVDPWSAVERLATLLRPGGAIIASIPNIRHIHILADLALKGRWQYQEQGILDRTHLRFFTLDSAVELMQPDGLFIQETRPLLGRFGRVVNLLTFTLLSGFAAKQYLIKATRNER